MKMHVAGKLGGDVDTPDLAGIIADVLGFTRNNSLIGDHPFAVSEILEHNPAQTVRGLAEVARFPGLLRCYCRSSVWAATASPSMLQSERYERECEMHWKL